MGWAQDQSAVKPGTVLGWTCPACAQYFLGPMPASHEPDPPCEFCGAGGSVPHLQPTLNPRIPTRRWICPICRAEFRGRGSRDNHRTKTHGDQHG
jgi:hypothetical protein